MNAPAAPARPASAWLAALRGWRSTPGALPAQAEADLARELQQALRTNALGEQVRQRHLLQLRAVMEAASGGVALTHERRFEFANAPFCRLLGWGRGELLGRSPYEVFSSVNADDALGAAVRTAFAAGQAFAGELNFRRRDGSTFTGRLRGQLVDAVDPTAGTLWRLDPGAAGAAVDTAQRDELTQLLTRSAFEACLAAWLAAPPAGLPASLLLLDLDRFKQINTLAGREAGDALLREVARVLQTHVRSGDLLARLDGDAYALLLPGCVPAVALQLGQRLRGELCNLAVAHAGGSLRVGASIGVAEIAPAAGLPAAEWMTRAHSAWYEAKYGQRGAVRLAPAAGGFPLVAAA